MTSSPNLCEVLEVNMWSCDFSTTFEFMHLCKFLLNRMKYHSYDLENHKCTINFHSIL